VNLSLSIFTLLPFGLQEFFEFVNRAAFNELKLVGKLALVKAAITQAYLRVLAAVATDHFTATVALDPITVRVCDYANGRLAAWMSPLEDRDLAAQRTTTDFAVHLSPSFPGNPGNGCARKGREPTSMVSPLRKTSCKTAGLARMRDHL
jgi:hypothetical protein